MHLQNGAIKKHFYKSHHYLPQRKLLDDNTSILHKENNFTLLKIREALYIKTRAPSINKQFDNFPSILKLFDSITSVQHRLDHVVDTFVADCHECCPEVPLENLDPTDQDNVGELAHSDETEGVGVLVDDSSGASLCAVPHCDNMSGFHGKPNELFDSSASVQLRPDCVIDEFVTDCHDFGAVVPMEMPDPVRYDGVGELAHSDGAEGVGVLVDDSSGISHGAVPHCDDTSGFHEKLNEPSDGNFSHLLNNINITQRRKKKEEEKK